MRPLKIVTELGLLLLCIEIIFGWVLAGRHKDDGLVQSRQCLHPLLASQDSLPQGLDSLVLFLAFLHVAFRDVGGGVGESVEVEEDLISRLLLMDVVDGEVEVVGSDGTLRTLIHLICNYNKTQGISLS